MANLGISQLAPFVGFKLASPYRVTENRITLPFWHLLQDPVLVLRTSYRNITSIQIEINPFRLLLINKFNRFTSSTHLGGEMVNFTTTYLIFPINIFINTFWLFGEVNETRAPNVMILLLNNGFVPFYC